MKDSSIAKVDLRRRIY